MGQIAGIAAGEVDETGSGHLRGEVRTLRVLPVEHLKGDRFDSHGPVMRRAEVDPVPDPFGAFLGGGRREEDGALAAPGEQLGVDGDHHLEKLAASHQRHRPGSRGVGHDRGPEALDIRFTLLVR